MMSMSKSSRTYTAAIPKMPPGLVELMEDLAKDVLKCNPLDVYSFCADHMKKLIEIRDGVASKRVMALEQKIAIANKKINERAARRREDFDKKTCNFKHLESSNNENCDHKLVDKNNTDAGQYIENNIVKIPEEDLIGNVEHEIIIKMKDKSSSSESGESTKINAETKLAETKSGSLSPPPASQQFNKTDNDNDLSEIDVIGNNDNENTEVMQDKAPIENDNVVIEIDKKHNTRNSLMSIESEVVSNSEEHSIAEIENYGETETSSVAIQNSDIVIESGKLTINYDNGENYEIDANKHNDVVIDETNELNDRATTSSSDVEKESISNNEDQSSLNSIEEHHGIKTTSTMYSTTLDEYNIRNANDDKQSCINNTSMDLETAAITIQKVFRNFLFKNKSLSTDDATNVDINSMIEENKNEKGNSDVSSKNVNKDRRSLGLSRIDTVLQTVNEEKSLSQSTDDSSTLSSAATIIQAHVRGFLTRNKLNVNKNSSTTSGIDSDGLSFTSIEGDNDNRKNKTILNIHIVPESGHFLSRDESVLTSIDLSLDGSPPCSTNLHPLGYDRSERRKQLKREDAIQSISPPSNNSGKLSEDVDSVKEIVINNENIKYENPLPVTDSGIKITDAKECSSAIRDLMDVNISTMVDNFDTALEVKSLGNIESPDIKYDVTKRPHSLPEMTSDEMDVITPFTPSEERFSDCSNLIHSGEFHEVVLPTKVARSETSVVREFQNVLAYFILWNNA